MNQSEPNPFDPPACIADEVASEDRNDRPKDRLVLIGSLILVASGLGAFATVVAMNLVFAEVAAMKNPKPTALADPIGIAVIPVAFAVPFCISGIALIATGVVRKRKSQQTIDD